MEGERERSRYILYRKRERESEKAGERKELDGE